MELDLLNLLQSDLATLDLKLAEGVDISLLAFLNKVLVANESMNLTAITDKVEAIHKHLIDSLSVLLLKQLKAQISQNPVWTDVGSGAGFPGMVLALAVPSASVHLVESTGKKAHFLNMASAELGLLKRVHVHNQRAETLSGIKSSGYSSKNVSRGTQHHKNSKFDVKKPRSNSHQEGDFTQTVPRETTPELRDSSDAVFFRGVSKLAGLIELGAPLLKIGGLLIAYKGPKASDELAEAARAMNELKMTLVERRDFNLPGMLEARSLICLQKTAETPKRFPRMPGLAQKEPITNKAASDE